MQYRQASLPQMCNRLGRGKYCHILGCDLFLCGRKLLMFLWNLTPPS